MTTIDHPIFLESIRFIQQQVVLRMKEVEILLSVTKVYTPIPQEKKILHLDTIVYLTTQRVHIMLLVEKTVCGPIQQVNTILS